LPIATPSPSPYVKPVQAIELGRVLAVHVTPSGDDWFPLVVLPVAIKTGLTELSIFPDAIVVIDAIYFPLQQT
jgi:hypothetical protein